MNNATISRIRKLLTLAQCEGATPAEAANAFEKAQRLAEKEGLSLGDIPADESPASSPLTHSILPSALSTFKTLPAYLIGQQIGVKVVTLKGGGDRPALVFIGLPHQVTIAIEAYRFLIGAMEASWQNRPDKRMKSRTSYAHGFCHGVSENLAAAIQRPGLIVAAGAYVEDTLAPELGAKVKPQKKRRKSNVYADTFQQGVTDGRRTKCPGAPQKPSPINRIPDTFF
jgi:hypothetical protein